MYSEGAKKARARIEAVERSIQQLEARQTRLIRGLEHTDDPHEAMLRKIRDRMSEIENERVHRLSERESLQQENPQADPDSLDLLDELPAGETDLAAAPSEVLRWLFEASGLRSATTNRRIARTAVSPWATKHLIDCPWILRS
jgi:hypothetical protein